MGPQIYLASRSPRRQELLRQVGVRFELLPADVPEQRKRGQSPADYAIETALVKARDRDEAVAMLSRLSGRTHEVFSAVAAVLDGRSETALVVTRVSFGAITPQQARAYWDTGEPADKAGAYAIQGFGAQFVKEIHGSYSGVVGLPLYETLQLLERFGVRS